MIHNTKKVIPAILADSVTDFKEKHNVLSSISSEIQIDIADGEFVDSKTVKLEEITNLSEEVIYEVHLMVARPLEYLEECARLGVKRIVVHVEIEQDLGDIIKKIKEKNFELVLAINPETNIAAVDMYIKDIDRVLLMSVEPGFGGQKLIAPVLEKARKLKEKYPDLIIEMDGGINVENIKEVFKSGVNVAYVGAGILKARDPKEEWEKFLEISGERK